MVHSLLKQAHEMADPARRYRTVWDAAHLAKGEDPPEVGAASDLFSPLEQVLRDAGTSHTMGPPDRELLRQVQAAVAELRNSTWNSFSEFASHPTNQERFDFSQPEGRQKFEAWFKRAQPYFTLDLPESSDEDAWAAFERRLAFLKERCAKATDGYEIERFEELLRDDFLSWAARRVLVPSGE